MTRRLTASLTLLIVLALSACVPHHASEQRLDEVTTRGAHVMPFSLEKTTHIFTKTPQGGVQQVVAKAAADVEQIRLIREHLMEISQKFARGDYSDPTRIHGDDMPGLKVLKAAQPGQLDIAYRELPAGAEITYATEDRTLIAAIHQWFDAQLSDHARHAMPGHSHHQTHHNP